MIAASGQNGSAASCQNRARRPPGCSCRVGKKLSTDIATARVIDWIETLEEIDLGRVLRFQSAYALRIRDASGRGLALEAPSMRAHCRNLDPPMKDVAIASMERPFPQAVHRNTAVAQERQAPNGLDQQHVAHAALG